MPPASLLFAHGVSQVRTPDHLVPLRERVRNDHGAELGRLHAEINERFGTTGATDDYVNVFYAASEMALMEWVGRNELPAGDSARSGSSGKHFSRRLSGAPPARRRHDGVA